MRISTDDSSIVLIRGGGDLASGVALRLHRVGFQVLITELPQPLVVRRMASFAEAIYNGQCKVEEVTGLLVQKKSQAFEAMENGRIAVMVDPAVDIRKELKLFGLVDGRMAKKAPDLGMNAAPVVIGLGPGFTAGENCHAVVETNRGPFLGRVYWNGSAENDSGIPESVQGYTAERVLYAPIAGVLQAKAQIGEIVEKGQIVAEIEGEPVPTRFRGVVRGLIQEGLFVQKGTKIGDIDPRCDVRLCKMASDKALAIGGGVLEALLTKYEGS